MSTSVKALCWVASDIAVVGIAYGQEKAAKAPEKAPVSGVPAERVQATNATGKPDFPVIGYLEKRGKIITIKAGPKGPLYSVASREGKILFENLSPEQLRAQAPELSEFLKTAVAGKTDARVRPIADSAMH